MLDRKVDKKKESLQSKVMMYGFIVGETALYLDTHPTCKDGLAYFQKYKLLKAEADMEYAAEYGPLTQMQVDSTESFTWLDNPWPWERSAY